MRHHLPRSLPIAVTLGLAGALLVACGGGGSAAPSPATGQLTLGMTDGPVDDAQAVVVKFTGVELQRANGELVSIDVPDGTIDLLKLQNGVTKDLIAARTLPAGEYQWMRLKVAATQNVPDSYIMTGAGGMFPLYVPSGFETGLKLQRGFTVAAGGHTKLIVDFDLRKSVHAAPGQAPNYMLRPALRLMDQMIVGKLAVTVDLRALTTAQFDAATAVTTCRPGLYVFPSSQAAPDDFHAAAAAGNPVVYLPLPNDGVNTTPAVTLPFLEAADYRVAATCNYDKDVADKDDYNPAAAQPTDPGYQTMKWTVLKPVTVAANATATLTLP